MPQNNDSNYTLTQYNVLVGGANNTIVNVAPGASGTVLISNGASANPSFQTTSGGSFTLTMRSINAANPSASTTYYPGTGLSITNASLTSTSAVQRIYIGKTCTLVKVYGAFTCTAGSSESATLDLYNNGSSIGTISTSLNFSSATVNFNQTYSASITAGDYIQPVFTTPAWTSAPTGVRMSLTFDFTF